jgi:hypothetical protein
MFRQSEKQWGVRQLGLAAGPPLCCQRESTVRGRRDYMGKTVRRPPKGRTDGGEKAMHSCARMHVELPTRAVDEWAR